MSNKKDIEEDIKILKEKCFADIDRNTCYCLDDKICKEKECRFYKTKEQARKDYFDTYSRKTAGNLDIRIDKYFRNL